MPETPNAVSSFSFSSPGFIVDPSQMVHSEGVSIAWDKVSDTRVVDGAKQIPAGTVLGADAVGDIFPVADAGTRGDVTAVGLLISPARENAKTHAISGYGMYVGGGPVYENVLPDAIANSGSPGDLPAADRTELQAAGTGFFFTDYSDSRLT